MNPLEVLKKIVVFDSRDWSATHRDRMLYAIVCGWDDECFEEFGWNKKEIEEYKRLHERFEELIRM